MMAEDPKPTQIPKDKSEKLLKIQPKQNSQWTSSKEDFYLKYRKQKIQYLSLSACQITASFYALQNINITEICSHVLVYVCIVRDADARNLSCRGNNL